jgi:hypothetical protein
MEPLSAAAAIGAALVAVVAVVLFVRARSQSPTSADSSDDETAGPLSVSVVAHHDEQDSLLPKFAGLLRSPWHSVTSSSSRTATGKKDPPKMMRPVRKGSRSMSLTMPLHKKRNPVHIPVKKVHVPYFFPLLDETAEWWQGQQLADDAESTQQTPEQEPEAGPDKHSEEDGLPSSNNKIQTATKELVQSKQLQHFSRGEMAATPIEVGGR